MFTVCQDETQKVERHHFPQLFEKGLFPSDHHHTANSLLALILASFLIAPGKVSSYCLVQNQLWGFTGTPVVVFFFSLRFYYQTSRGSVYQNLLLVDLFLFVSVFTPAVDVLLVYSPFPTQPYTFTRYEDNL